MRAVLLARVSTEEQVVALAGQVNKLEKYAKERGFSPVELVQFHESAWSVDDHSQMRSVITMIRSAGEPVALVLDKTDRLTRGFSQELTDVYQLLKQGKIELHFPSENLVLNNYSPASELFRLGINVALSKYYSDAISDNVKRRIDQKLLAGEWPGRAPMGYRNVTNTDGSKDIVLDEPRAAAIAKAFEMRADGYSFSAIRTHLNEDGFTTPLSGRPLAKSQLEDILHNPFYFGEMRYNGRVTAHRYPAIVPRWQWDRAQQVNDQRGAAQLKRQTRNLLYAGLIKCAYCGCSVTADLKKGKYVYLKCTQYRGKCPAIRVGESLVTDQVMALLRAITIPTDELEAIRDDLRRAHEAEQRSQAGSVSRLRAEYDILTKKMATMYEDRLEGRITAGQYDLLIAGYKVRQEQLNDRLAGVTSADEEFLVTSSYLLELASRAAELFESSTVDEKRQLLSYLVSNFQLKGEKVLIKLKTPFDAIAECSEMMTWLPLSGKFRTLHAQVACHQASTLRAMLRTK